jgi:hypothetical protein
VKIVRKADRTSGDTLAVWIGNDDRLMAWWEFDGSSTADEEIARYPVYAGWTIGPREANRIGTTLAALRAELEGEG